MTARWFAPVFAVVQTLRHAGLLAHSYWTAGRYDTRFDAWDFVHRDLARPFFEPFGFCDAWVQYSFGQAAVLGLDLPVYAIATLLHSVLSGQTSCVDAVTTPRGHIITVVLAFPVWFMAGLGLRRLVRREWRRPAKSKTLRCLAYAILLLSAPFGGLMLVLGVVATLVSPGGTSIYALGAGLWLMWAGALAAERLRTWPFDRLAGPSG